MKKVIFAILAASIMVLLTFGTMSASAGPDGTIYGTVFFEIEDDWGNVDSVKLGGVIVTITRSDGDSEPVTTNSKGYYSHTVRFEGYEKYTVSVNTIPEFNYGGKVYKLLGTSEGAWLRPINNVVGKQVLINMPAIEITSKEKTVEKPLINSNLRVLRDKILFQNMLRGIFESLSI